MISNHHPQLLNYTGPPQCAVSFDCALCSICGFTFNWQQIPPQRIVLYLRSEIDVIITTFSPPQTESCDDHIDLKYSIQYLVSNPEGNFSPHSTCRIKLRGGHNFNGRINDDELTRQICQLIRFLTICKSSKVAN